MGGEVHRLTQRRPPIAVEDRGYARLAGEAEQVHGAFGPARVAKHGGHVSGQTRRQPRGVRGKVRVRVGHQEALAAGVDEDRGGRRTQALETAAQGAIDPLPFEFRHDGVCRCVKAESCRQRSFAAEARHGHGGIGGDPAPDDGEILRAILLGAHGHGIDREDEVEHCNADAKDAGHGIRRDRTSTSKPSIEHRGP